MTFCNSWHTCDSNLVALCNNNMLHCVIRNMSKNPLQIRFAIVCHNIILSIYLPTFPPTSILHLLPLNVWPPDLVGWRIKTKGHPKQIHVIPSWRGQVIMWEMKNVMFQIPILMKGCLSTKSHNQLILWTKLLYSLITWSYVIL